MESAASIDAFCARPINHWVAAGTGVVWCASEELCGCAVFGVPDAEATSELVRAFEALHHPEIGPRFSVIVDSSRIERLEPEAIAVLVQWVARERTELIKRVRLQVGVAPTGAAAKQIASVVPLLGELHLYRVVESTAEAFRLVSPQNDTLLEEVNAITEHVLSIPTDIRRLRQLLAHDAAVTVDNAARTLGLSPRALQRSLESYGTAFNDEVKAARFSKACRLLESTDDDPRDIANAVGLSEVSLNQLFKDKARISPGDYRNRSRQ